MLVDYLIEQIKQKKNPCIVGLDPEWEKLPDGYKTAVASEPEVILQWAMDVIDSMQPFLEVAKYVYEMGAVFSLFPVSAHREEVLRTSFPVSMRMVWEQW